MFLSLAQYEDQKSTELGVRRPGPPGPDSANHVLWRPFKGKGTSKVKVVRKLSSLSSIHSEESSNICLHSSNDGELTSFGTSLLVLTTGC